MIAIAPTYLGAVGNFVGGRFLGGDSYSHAAGSAAAALAGGAVGGFVGFGLGGLSGGVLSGAGRLTSAGSMAGTDVGGVVGALGGTVAAGIIYNEANTGIPNDAQRGIGDYSVSVETSPAVSAGELGGTLVEAQSIQASPFDGLSTGSSLSYAPSPGATGLPYNAFSSDGPLQSPASAQAASDPTNSFGNPTDGLGGSFSEPTS